MNLREILTNAGIEENTIKTIEIAMKANNVYITNEQNADIRLKKNKEKIEKLEGELDDAVTKIEDFKDLENKNNTLTQEIETLKKSATEKEFDTILNTALKAAKSKNDKIIKALLDREKLILKDGKIEGIEEQLKTIREENDFLFEKEIRGVPDFISGGKGEKGGSEPPKEKSIGEKLAEAKSNITEIKY